MIEVWSPTQAEYDQAIEAWLVEAGVTVEELERQAKSTPCGCCGFDTPALRDLWRLHVKDWLQQRRKSQ